MFGRSPHGERGLKLCNDIDRSARIGSLSSRRAWIEIIDNLTASNVSMCRSPHGERGLKSVLLVDVLCGRVSLSSRRAWIEILRLAHVWKAVASTSLSSRRAWIEIAEDIEAFARTWVALLTESVD